MSNNAVALNNAMNVLGSFFGAVSRADYMFKAMGGNTASVIASPSNPDAPEENKTIQVPMGQAAARILDIIDGGLYLCEITEKCDVSGGEDLYTGLSEDDKKVLASAFTMMGGDVTDLAIGFLAKTPMGGDGGFLGKQAATVNQEKIPTSDKPGLCAINVQNPVLNFANRDSGAVQVFMNAIPTLEFSRCQVYVNMQIIIQGAAVDADGRSAGISLFRFVSGQSKTTEGSVERWLADAQPLDIKIANAENQAAVDAGDATTEDATDDVALAQFSSAGMEVFTHPQTLIPVTAAGQQEVYSNYEEMGATLQESTDVRTGDAAFPGEPGTNRAAPIIDRMRPFMTLTGIKMNIKPTRGPMSMKTGAVSFTLHDRSRLAEIAPLVKPSQFGTTELLLEYGWSHPDGQLPIGGTLTGGGGMNNPYGFFLNALKTKEKYTVYNSKYAFKPDGQVDITLNVVSKGGDNTASLDVGMTPEIQAQWALTEKVIQTTTELRKKIFKDEGMRDIIGDQVVASVSPTNVNDMINGEDAAELTKWIRKNAKGEGDIKELADSYQKIKDAGAAAKKSIAAVIKEKGEIAYGKTLDPFFETQDKDSGEKSTELWTRKPDGVGQLKSCCSFGKLALLFIGLPLAASGRFDEVQLFFYPINKNASYMAGKTTGNFPVTKAEYDLVMNHLKKEYVQININQWFSNMNRLVLKSMAAKAYGFGNLYTRDEDGKSTQTSSTKRAGATALKTAKDEILQKAYGGKDGVETVFKQPLIKMFTECVPHKRDTGPELPGEGNTILRLHFVDAQCSSYSSYGEMMMSARNNAVAGQSATVQEFDDTDPVNWDKTKSVAMDQASSLNFIKKSGNYNFVVGGAQALKYFIKSNMPHINYGSQASAVLNASIQTMSDSKNATIHMIRAQKAGGSDQGAAGDQDRGLPARMMPMQMSMDIIGCPLVNFMQQFFVDFGTGTTVDNIYAVTQVDHDITPGKFQTKLKFVPLDAYGRYESLIGTMDKAIETAKIEPKEEE